MFTRNLTVVFPPSLSARLSFRSLGASGVESVRAAFRAIAAWRRRRKQRKELLEYLASDHRAAADIGYRYRQEEFELFQDAVQRDSVAPQIRDRSIVRVR